MLISDDAALMTARKSSCPAIARKIDPTKEAAGGIPIEEDDAEADAEADAGDDNASKN